MKNIQTDTNMIISILPADLQGGPKNWHPLFCTP